MGRTFSFGRVAGLCLISFTFILSCGAAETASQTSASVVLAHCAGTSITEEYFEEYVDELPLSRRIPPPNISDSEWKSKTLKELCANALIADRATTQGYENHPTYQRLLTFFTRENLLHMLHLQEVEDPVRLSAKDLWDYYDSHKQQFTEPGTLSFRVIYFSAPERQEPFKKALSQGKTFEQLEKEFSTLSALAKGKVQGPYTRKQLEKMFQDAALVQTLQKTPSGQLTPLLKTPKGFYAFRIEQVTPEKLRPAAEVFTDICEQLESQRQGERYQKLCQQLVTTLVAHEAHPELLDAATTQPTDVLLSIGKQHLTRGDFEEAYKRRAPAKARQSLSQADFFPQWALEQLQLAYAHQKQLDRTPDCQKRLGWFRVNQLSNLWLELELDKLVKRTLKDGREYYSAHPEEFVDGQNPTGPPPPFAHVQDVAMTKAVVYNREKLRDQLRAEALEEAGYREFPEHFFPEKAQTLREALNRFRQESVSSASQPRLLGAISTQPEGAAERQSWGRRQGWRLYMRETSGTCVAYDVFTDAVREVKLAASDLPSTAVAEVSEKEWLLDSSGVGYLAMESWAGDFMRRHAGQKLAVTLALGFTPQTRDYACGANEYLFLMRFPLGEQLPVAVDTKSGQTRRVWTPELKAKK